MATVHKKLMQARIKLHALKIEKSGRNEFAKYNYMELADFLIPMQQILFELGLCGVVSFTADMATLTITDAEDGSQIVVTSPMGSAALKGCHEVQQIGAVETYQRRYLWVAAMEIVEHDAIDGTELLETSPRQSKTKPDAPKATEDMSLKGRAQRIKTGISCGDAVGASLAMSGWPEAELNGVWALLDAATQEKLTASWPK